MASLTTKTRNIRNRKRAKAGADRADAERELRRRLQREAAESLARQRGEDEGRLTAERTLEERRVVMMFPCSSPGAAPRGVMPLCH